MKAVQQMSLKDDSLWMAQLKTTIRNLKPGGNAVVLEFETEEERNRAINNDAAVAIRKFGPGVYHHKRRTGPKGELQLIIWVDDPEAPQTEVLPLEAPAAPVPPTLPARRDIYPTQPRTVYDIRAALQAALD